MPTLAGRATSPTSAAPTREERRSCVRAGSSLHSAFRGVGREPPQPGDLTGGDRAATPVGHLRGRHPEFGDLRFGLTPAALSASRSLARRSTRVTWTSTASACSSLSVWPFATPLELRLMHRPSRGDPTPRTPPRAPPHRRQHHRPISSQASTTPAAPGHLAVPTAACAALTLWTDPSSTHLVHPTVVPPALGDHRYVPPPSGGCDDEHPQAVGRVGV